MSLTEKQQAFVVNKAAGVKNKEAAIAAGYSASAAAVTASQLLARKDIKDAIAKAKRDMRANGYKVPKDADEEEQNKKTSMPRTRYTDPKDFLTDLMNHKHQPIAMRADAAFKLMPYMHARIGEKGKKETAKERAGEIARGGGQSGKPKFATKAPPPLRAIPGGKA